jgi:YgiT-type zinc finger domain-containing protein
MVCTFCKGSTKLQTINFPIDLESTFILVKEVPAIVCQQCGEYFLEDNIAERIEDIAETAKSSNIEIEVLKFAA